ncbi:MAG TPA: hypothetical protein EYP90_11755, partial [Chromatiaceae bacterium]|nr:hypothetical protein [Chromatiaceae bacterium]
GEPITSAESWARRAPSWRPLIAVAVCPPNGRRVRVALRVEADRGVAWFDDLLVTEAGLPFSAALFDPRERALLTAPRAATVSGMVLDFRGEPARWATVWAEPGGLFSTAQDGGFVLELPEGRFTLRAVSPENPTASAEIAVRAGERRRLDIKLPLPPFLQRLINPGFEIRGPAPGYIIGWRKWGTVDGIMESGRWLFGIRAHGGRFFFGTGAGSNTKNGGIYQTIKVFPGALYQVSAWHLTRREGGRPGDVANRLGVDPTGGRDPNAPTVIWTPFRWTEGRWERLSLRVRAKGPALTIFLQFRQRQGIPWSANAFDDVEVRRISGQES